MPVRFLSYENTAGSSREEACFRRMTGNRKARLRDRLLMAEFKSQNLDSVPSFTFLACPKGTMASILRGSRYNNTVSSA